MRTLIRTTAAGWLLLSLVTSLSAEGPAPRPRDNVPPLPIFGTYTKDQIPAADPSLEVSVALTKAPLAPARIGEVPFVPSNLPDPFENAETVRLRQPWPEDVQ